MSHTHRTISYHCSLAITKSHEHTRALDAACSSSLSHKEKKISQTIARKGSRTDNPIHCHTMCNVCHVSPIIGLRFKCLERGNYDLCEICENKNGQPFPMIKMYESHDSWHHKNTLYSVKFRVL